MAEHEALADAGGVAEHRPVGSTTERRGVHDQERGVGVDRTITVHGGARVAPRLVAVGGVVVVAYPSGRAVHLAAGVVDGRTDFFVLPDHDPGIEIVDDERQLLGALAPVDGTEQGPELRRREERLEHPEGVLSDPADPLSALDADTRQLVGELVRPSVERPVVESYVAVDGGELARPAPSMFSGQVAEGEGVHELRGQGSTDAR